MNALPPDEPPLLEGVWVGADPHPPASGSPAPPSVRRVHPGWVVGVCVLLTVVAVAATLVFGSRLLGVAVAVAGLVGGVGCFLAFARPREPLPPPDRLSAGPADAGEASAPLKVVYTPAQLDAGDPHTAELESTLLRYCRGDYRVFNRLVEHERQRHPHLSRPDLLQLAIDHFRRDHQ